VEDGWRRRTLLHEVAHAWIDQNVDQTTTAAFMELRGTEVWAAWDHAWEDRGTEHAAETLMWGIQDGDYKIDFRLDNVDCDELSAGYEMLTGTTVSCEISPD
jgi:hypothetical protein